MSGFGNREESQVAAVVEFSELQAMQRKASMARIESYWRSLRGPRMLPLHADIDPREFKGALDYCFALERTAPGSARFRVAGSHLSRLIGRAAIGTLVSSLLAASCREAFGKTLDEVFEAPATASLLLRAETTDPGRPPVRAWMNLLPVADASGATSRVIGVFVSERDPGNAPLRFGIERTVLTRLEPDAQALARAFLRSAPEVFLSRCQVDPRRAV